MNNSKTYSLTAFNFSIISWTLIVLLKIISLAISDFASGLSIIQSGIIGIPIIIISIIGFIKSMKGIKEPNSLKKLVGIALNSIVVLFFFYALLKTLFNFFNFNF